MEEQQEAPQFNIELPEEVSQGQYANLAVVLHTQSEFVLDFVRLLPGQQSAKVHSRQILTPDRLPVGNRTHDDRLQDADLSDGGSEFGEIVLPENAAQDSGAN